MDLNSESTAGDNRGALAQVTDLLSVAPEQEEQEEETGVEGEQLETVDEESEELDTETLETEEEEESDEPTEDGDAEPEEIADLQSLAEAIGVEVSFLYDLGMRLSDDGEVVKLGELKDRLQDQNRLEAEKRRLLEERSAFEASRTQATEVDAQLQQAIVQSQAEVLMLQSQFQNTDWRAMEEADPGRAALYKQDLMAAHNQAAMKLQQAQQQQAQTAQQLRLQKQEEETTKLLSYVEEWRDPKIRTQETAEITSMLVSEYGYTPQEIKSTLDHRQVRVIRDLWNLKKRAGSAATTVKKLKKLPRQMKPGAPQRRTSTTKQRELNATLKRAAESKSIRDKSSAISALLQSTGVSK